MIQKKYLNGIPFQPSERFKGLYYTHDYRNHNHPRIICSYEVGKSHKSNFFLFLRRHGQKEVQKDWELHHIVEGQHFADIDFSGRLGEIYKKELPCVLLHKDEHIAYNQLLHIKQTDELFRDNLPKDLFKRSQFVAESSKNKSKKKELFNRIEHLRCLYLESYSGDPTLQRISLNIFHEAENVLTSKK